MCQSVNLYAGKPTIIFSTHMPINYVASGNDDVAKKFAKYIFKYDNDKTSNL